MRSFAKSSGLWRPSASQSAGLRSTQTVFSPSQSFFSSAFTRRLHFARTSPSPRSRIACRRILASGWRSRISERMAVSARTFALTVRSSACSSFAELFVPNMNMIVFAL